MIDLARLVDVLDGLEERKSFHRLEHYKPYDFQLRFHNALGKGTEEPARQKALMAANQVGKCSSISTLIETKLGEKILREIWGKRCSVLTWPHRAPRPVVAWVRKPAEPCYRVTLADGRWFECPLGHVVLAEDVGFVPISRIFSSLPRSVWHARGLRESVRRGALRLTGRARGFLGRCFDCLRLRGERLHRDADGVEVFAPSPDGARAHILAWYALGDRAGRYTSICRRAFARLSSWGAALRPWVPFAPLTDPAVSPSDRQSSCYTRISRLFPDSGYRPHTSGKAPRGRSCASEDVRLMGAEIVSVDPIGCHVLYDMEVAHEHNYYAAGVVHHNTLSGGAEVAIHATGEYPDWWRGPRFNRGVEVTCGSNTNETTRDRVQKELLGEPADSEMLGTGWIPRSRIVGTPTRKPGVPNAFDSCLVEHVNGGRSKINFRAYEQGAKKHMGGRIDIGWMDEEPPPDIWSQYLRGTFSTDGYLLLTFTPEEGVTEVVYAFQHNLKIAQAFITASWDDAPHMTEEKRARFLAQIPAHERDMRTRGLPLLGSGVVFPVADEELMIDPIQIPAWWPRIIGLDFGWEHPTAGVWMAWDRDADVIYIYHEYREERQLISMNASAIKATPDGKWAPIAWPHDGMMKDKQSGRPLRDLYAAEGLNMLVLPFSNPPPPGKKEGEGGQGVEVGLMAMLEAMELGRFKVFSTCQKWFEEKRIYHRQEGQIIKLRDDLMSATRYGFQSRRFAITKPTVSREPDYVSVGERNWGG